MTHVVSPGSNSLRRARPRSNRRAFTLPEAMAAITVVALAGAVVLAAAESAVQVATSNVDEVIARGLARQMIDEVLGTRWGSEGASPQQYPMAANTWELGGAGRERFNDTDDYDGVSVTGAEDLWGMPLGTGNDQGGLRHANFRVAAGYFQNWRQEISVYYLSETNPAVRLTGSQTSLLREVEVRISKRGSDGTYRPLATSRAIFAYAPPI